MSIVKFRLTRDSDVPPSPDGSAYKCGLQDTRGELHEGLKDAQGRLTFTFELKVAFRDLSGLPRFTGLFASGPPEERFVYLSWAREDGTGYINRIKARLRDLNPAQVRAAQEAGKVLETDLTDRHPGGGQVAVSWQVVDDQT